MAALVESQTEPASTSDASDRPDTGSSQVVSPLIRRIVAPNPGPFTGTGTCTYIVGQGEVAVIDPGPDNEDHRGAILAALGGERVSQIVVTHTHLDHSPGARQLAALTGAPIVGCAPYRRSRAHRSAEQDAFERSSDLEYRPDRELRDGDEVSGPGWTLRAVATPGHTANHLAFALPEERALFSGDHVMAWSTTVVAPPDGSMTDYMASLEKLRDRDEDDIYWPGHGGPVRDPRRLVRGFIAHRRQRETAILTQLRQGRTSTATIVAAIYQDIAPALVGAARLSVFAHLEDLVSRGLAVTDGEPALGGVYKAAS